MAISFDEAKQLKPGDTLNFGTEYNYHFESFGPAKQGELYLVLTRDDGYQTFATHTDLKVANKLPAIAVGDDAPATPQNTPKSAVGETVGRYQVLSFNEGENPATSTGAVRFEDNDVDGCMQYINKVAAKGFDYYIFDTQTDDFVDPGNTSNGAEGATEGADPVQVDTDDETTTSTPKSRKGK